MHLHQTSVEEMVVTTASDQQACIVSFLPSSSNVFNSYNQTAVMMVMDSRSMQIYILNETSKPPLYIFSYILTYMIHTWLQFTLNMEKSMKLNLSKFHFHKLELTCSIDRLSIGTIAFHFHINAKI